MRDSKYFKFLFYSGFSLLFILFAILYKLESFSILTAFSVPFIWAGDIIRFIGAKSIVFAYILYIIAGILPLIFPLIRAIKVKKLFLRDISWLLSSAILFVVLYYFINPHKIDFALFDLEIPDTIKNKTIDLTLLGYAITVYAILLFSILAEFYAKITKKENRIYLYAKILFSILIIGVLFNLFFIELFSTKTKIDSIPKSNELIYINRPVNIFAIICAYALKLLPAFTTVLLLLRAKDFIGNLQADAFSKNNIPKLNTIIKSCFGVIFVNIGAIILENILYLILSDKLLNSYYNSSLPVGMILTACLILIFSKILIKAIDINEENKLVV